MTLPTTSPTGQIFRTSSHRAPFCLAQTWIPPFRKGETDVVLLTLQPEHIRGRGSRCRRDKFQFRAMLQMQVGSGCGGVHEYRPAPSPSGTCIKPSEIEFSPRADRAGLRKQGLVIAQGGDRPTPLPTALGQSRNSSRASSPGRSASKSSACLGHRRGSVQKYMTGLSGLLQVRRSRQAAISAKTTSFASRTITDVRSQRPYFEPIFRIRTVGYSGTPCETCSELLDHCAPTSIWSLTLRYLVLREPGKQVSLL